MNVQKMLIGLAFTCLFHPDVFANETSECDPQIIKTVGINLNVPNLDFYQRDPDKLHIDAAEIISAACKVWPYDKTKVIAAFSYYEKDTTINPESYYNKITYFVGIISTLDDKIKYTYKWWSNDICCETPTIDTARYDLAPGVRAFGIDINPGNGPSTVSGGYGYRRTLFIVNEGTLSTILKDLYLEDWKYQKEGVVNNDLTADHSLEKNKYIISVAPTVTNGFHDLIINVVTTLSDESGLESKKATRVYKKLQYVNGIYQ